MRIPSNRRATTFLVALSIALLSAAPAGADTGRRPVLDGRASSVAPILGRDAAGAIAERFIVVFDKAATARHVQDASRVARSAGASVHHTYAASLRGFAATLPAAALRGLSHNPHVAFIEADQAVQLDATQTPATWGLDRIDQRNLPLNNSYTYNQTGTGVRAYVIDTGIRATHAQFGGRVGAGFTSINDGRGTTDCNGHGTHVAGTIGGSTYGVAKGVIFAPVRVLGCNGSGSTSGVIAGVDWVTGNHAAGQPAVANMSLGGGISSALDAAVNNSINDGVSYAVAAGNSNTNACNSSPARVPAAITVGSTTSSDARSSFSNFGTCLDLFAPGSSITSAWSTSDTATNTISGTSMATPHVAGVAALYLETNPAASALTVRNAIVASATPGVVTGAGSGSPNLLLHSLLGSTPPPPPPPPTGCTLQQTFTGTLSGPGDADYQPNGTYYFSGVSGLHRGCLTGPAGTDFDLYLQKWSGFGWSNVAQGIGTTSIEDVSYNGTSGYYVWRVVSYSGSGSYTLSTQRP